MPYIPKTDNGYDRIMSGQFTRSDYVRSKMARDLKRFEKLEIGKLKQERYTEVRASIDTKLAQVSEKCGAIAAARDGTVVKSSNENLVQFIDGDANVARAISIQPTSFAQRSCAEAGNYVGRFGDINNLTLNSEYTLNNGAIGNNADLFQISVDQAGANATTIRTQQNWVGGGAPNTYTIRELINDVNAETVNTGVSASLHLGQLVLRRTQEVVIGGQNVPIDAPIYFRTRDLISAEALPIEGGWTNGWHGTGWATEATVALRDNVHVARNVTAQGGIIEVDGARFRILGTNGAEACTFTQASDPAALAGHISDLADAMGTLLTELSSLMTEMPDPQAQLPSAEEREEMTDEEISKREAKVTRGMFRRSPELKSMADEIKNIFRETLSGFAVGVDTWDSGIGIKAIPGPGRNIKGFSVNKEQLARAISSGIQGPDPAHPGAMRVVSSAADVKKALFGASVAAAPPNPEFLGGFSVRLEKACRDNKTTATQKIKDTLELSLKKEQFETELKRLEVVEARLVKQYNRRQQQLEILEAQSFFAQQNFTGMMAVIFGSHS